MSRISGFTDQGRDRYLDVQELADGVRIDLRSPGGSGTAIIVARPALLDLLGRAAGSVPGIGRFMGKTLVVSSGHPDRPGDFYLWIQGVGGKGWSIYVNPARLHAALRERGITTARAPRGPWAPENRGISESLN